MDKIMVKGTNWELRKNSYGMNTVRRKVMPYLITKENRIGWQMWNRDYEKIGGPIRIRPSKIKAIRQYSKEPENDSNTIYFYSDGNTPWFGKYKTMNDNYFKILKLLSDCEFLISHNF